MHVSALIPAAGSGERLGRGPKALLKLGAHTLLERAIQAFEPFVDEIIIGLPEALLEKTDVPRSIHAIAGGSTRQATVQRLLEKAAGEFVLIHDVARPFLSQEVIERVLQAAQRTGAATAVVPAADTLVLERAGFWTTVLERSSVRQVQTPQGFRRSLLQEAHRHAQTHGMTGTDDAGLVAALSHPVELVDGDTRLMKITRQDDLQIALAYAEIWDSERLKRLK